MTLDYCYHTHTKRCGHASGEDEEYIKAAIETGIKRLGFTDHVFLPDFKQPGFRGDISLLDEYVDSLLKLKEKYKEQIEIHIGFEAEYADCLYPYYKSLIDNKKIKYLICGQHMFFDAPNDGYQIGKRDNQNDALEKYAYNLEKAMASGLFKYIAHPDYFLIPFDKIEGKVEEVVIRICKASIKYDIPLELNLQGFNNRGKDCKHPLWYPSIQFFKYVEQYGCKVIIGLDAHAPAQFASAKFDKMEEILSSCHLNLIDNIF